MSGFEVAMAQAAFPAEAEGNSWCRFQLEQTDIVFSLIWYKVKLPKDCT